MTQVVIQTEGLGKRYRIGTRERYRALRDVIAAALSAPARTILGRSSRAAGDTEHFWALKDVSFDIREGEVIGLIGRNGAGKSTLLKILARITRPTEGRAEIRGRVGSLLEVGTGFHPELTGRENIYLSGAILGMKKAEIARKFDEIVAFAEVDRFLDTPLKHYSSGMQMRLAFAVAAHLDPEILLVDEVLAVGDAAFQKKCLAKMGDVARDGRTILFVSHNTVAVRSLCNRAFLIDQGQIVFSSTAEECIEKYLISADEIMPVEVLTADIKRPSEVAHDTTLRITRIRLETQAGEAIVHSGRRFELTMDFEVADAVENVLLAFAVHSLDGTRIFECRSLESVGLIESLSRGRYSIRCSVPCNRLNPGLYTITVGSRNDKKGLDWIPSAMSFRVDLPDKLHSLWLEECSGLIRQESNWDVPVKYKGRVGVEERVRVEQYSL